MSHQQQPTDSTSNGDEAHDSLLRRSWHAMSDLFQPFSSSALDKLPKSRRPQRYTRVDEIPDVDTTDGDGQMPTVRDYHSITVPPQVRVPKKIPTPVRVESKVWFANERSKCLDLPTHNFFFCPYISPLRLSAVVCRCCISYVQTFGLSGGPVPIAYAHRVVLAWVSYLNMSILIGTLAVALFNASKDPIARNFAYVYALISIGILVRIRSVRILPSSLLSLKYPSLPFTSIVLLLREAVSLMLSLHADLRLGCIPATCHQDPQA